MNKINEIVKEVLMAVLPVCVIMMVLILYLGLIEEAMFEFISGVFLVVVGFIMFLIGVKLGLLPFGERLGSLMTSSLTPRIIILMGFLLGLVITIAEPDVRVLATLVDDASGGQIARNILIGSVALGVGLFTALTMYRMIHGIPLVKLLLLGYGLVLLLAFFSPPQYFSVSFDAGGVTTGPITVPFILALGIGVVNGMKGREASREGFGVIALASIGPIIAVLLLGLIFR